MASGQASTGTVTGATGADDGWKTVSGGGDDGWKTVSGPEPEAAAQPKLFMPHKSDMHMLDVLDRKIGKTKITKDNVPSAFQGPMGGGEPGGENLQSKILGAYGAAAGIEGVGAAGAALLKGSLRPALGLVAGFGTGYGVDRAARALGAPGWVAESIATLAAIEVGGKVGMSPEMTARLKNSGFKGIIERWINGEPKPNEVNEFYKAKYGKLPETGEEILTAKAEAAEFKKSVAAKIRESAKPATTDSVTGQPLWKPPKKKLNLKRSPGTYDPLSESGGTKPAVGMTGPKPEKGLPIPKKPEGVDSITGRPLWKPPNTSKLKLRSNPGSYDPLSETGGGANKQVGMTGPKFAKPEAGAEAIESKAETPKSKTKLKDKARGAAPKGTAPAAKGSSYGFTHPKESLTDVRKQLFSNTQQQKIPNDQVRVRFTQLHGHGISAGTYEEIQQFNEYIARNGKLPDAPGVK